MVKEITIYFVGTSKQEAWNNLPFDSYESAESYCLDNPGTEIYHSFAYLTSKNLEKFI